MFDNVKSTINIASRLELQPEKTQYFKFENNEITNCENEFENYADCSNQFMNFLGVAFDGRKVRIRAKLLLNIIIECTVRPRLLLNMVNILIKVEELAKRIYINDILFVVHFV